MNNNIKWASIQQIAEDPKYPFTLAMIRHYLLHRHKNGLENAVRKIGKRLFVRLDLLDAWIESQVAKGGKSC
jgi:hypothetical protein